MGRPIHARGKVPFINARSSANTALPLSPGKFGATGLFEQRRAAKVQRKQKEDQTALGKGISLQHTRVSGINPFRLPVGTKARVRSRTKGRARRLKHDAPNLLCR